MIRRRIIHAKDGNQDEIVEALQDVGATVDIVGDPVDLLVGFRGTNYLMEVKVDEKRELTDNQVKFFREWRGQVARVNNKNEALALLGILV